MLISWLVVLIAIAGLIIFVLASNPKASQLGYAMFCCGLLAACLRLGSSSVHLPG
jgi:Na+/phosphate symporter